MKKRSDVIQDAQPSQPYDTVDENDGASFEEDSQNGYEDDASEYEEINDTHRFHIAMNVFNLISILVGLAIILVLVAVLVSLATWLQGDVSQTLTLFTANIK